MYYKHLETSLTTEQAGGKGANLATLSAHGFNVPSTFMLDPLALKTFLNATKLDGTVRDHLERSPSFSHSQMSSAYERLCEQVLEMAFPDPLQIETKKVVEELLAVSPFGVAVRSSAVIEDSDRASCAGVFESYLGLLDLNTIIEHIKRSWCSLWSPKAIRYLARLDLECPPEGMAVILQTVIAARVSGVIYTADPQSGNPWRFALHATRGLSIDLMSGSGEGETYELDWCTGSTVSRRTPKSATEIIATSDGLASRESDDATTGPVLTDSEIEAVARIAREIDSFYDKRMDIEWAIEDETIWVIQARPLTALPAFFPVESSADDDRIWNLAPLFIAPRVDVPLGFITPFYADMSEGEMWNRHQPEDFPLTTMWIDERDLNGYRYYEPIPSKTFQNYFKNAQECESWLLENEKSYSVRWLNRHQELANIHDEALQAIAETRTAAELIPVMVSVRDRFWDLVSFGWSGPQALGWMCDGVLTVFLKDYDITIPVKALLCSDSTSFTLMMASEYQRLGHSLRDLPEGSVFENLPLDQIMPHLYEHHEHSGFLAELNAVRWRIGRVPMNWRTRPAFWWFGDDLQMVHSLKQSMVGGQKDAAEVFRVNSKQCRMKCEQISEKLIALGEETQERFERILKWTQFWSQALNDRHGLGVGQLSERELLWETGCRLTDERLIAQPQDVLFLRREDLEQLHRAGPRAFSVLYESRKLEYASNLRLVVPAVLGAEEAARLPWEPKQGSSTHTSAGGTGFAGESVTGRARCIADLLDPEVLDSLQSDEILILPHDDAFAYADWHSLLLLVRGVVSVGRPAHHLVQVARECGIPVVGYVSLGAVDGMEGKTISIDGQSGEIKCED